jgi:hypothetical protein
MLALFLETDMKKYLLTLWLLLSLSACSRLVFNPQQAFDQLAAAQTPEEEAAAFEHIWSYADELGFGAYDIEGKGIPVSSPDFPARIHAIDLHVNGETYRHILIEPENIFILMRE